MSDPNLEEAPLTRLSDDYIRDLEPENQRYDITLAQDFVISVLPNGIKTWAFIYDFQGRHRRKTLGVFPEMNFDDAKMALEKARASMLRMDEPTVAPNEFGQLPAVLGGSSYIPSKKKKTRINWKPLLKLLAGLIVLGVLGLAGLKFIEYQKTRTTEAVPDNSATAPAALPFAIDKADDTSSAPPQNQPEPGEDQTGGASDTTAPAETSPAPSSTSSSAPSNNPASTNNSTPAPVRQATPPQASAPAPAPRADIEPEPVTSTPRPAPVTTLTTTTKATAFGGRVARSQLTSRVENLEPTDTLGPEISYKNSGVTRVFYYTELREFGDGDVVHRWSLNGEVQDEVALTVKKSWRWRTYSNKDLTPGLNGEWKVETIDATGKILDTENFTYDYQ